MEEKYKHFGLIGIDGRIQSELSYQDGMGHYKTINKTDDQRIIRNLKSKASWDLAHASETALKSFIIYTDLIRMPYFTKVQEERNISHLNKNGQPVMSYYPKMNGEEESVWRLLLDGRRDELSIQEQSKYTDPKFGMIGKPSQLLQEIKTYSLSGDYRKNPDYLIIDPVHSYDFRKVISGHDLFAYFKLQSPEIQVLINNELFLLGDKVSMEDKIIGILLGYGNDSNQNNESQKSVYKNSLAFPKRRFDWITGSEISDFDLEIIKDFAKININIAKQKFPDEDIFRYILNKDYSCFKNTIFDLLDPVGKFYSLMYFSNDEINTIINIAKTNNLSKSDALTFVTMCLHFKRNIKEIMKDNSSEFVFDFAKASNIFAYTDQMKSYDSNGFSKLEDSDTFIIHLGEIEKEKNKLKTIDKISSYIEMLNSGNTEILKIRNDESFEGHPEMKIGPFWRMNRDRIIHRIIQTLFEDERYKDNPKYDLARKIVSEYQYQTDQSAKTDTFIEMLNSGNTEILRIHNDESFDGHPEIKVGPFWQMNRGKIIQTLFEDERYKDNPKYDLARKTISEYVSINSNRKRM